MLRLGSQEGPNFAGHFTVITWGCGSPCHTTVVVDAKSGRVFDGLTSQYDEEYRLDSRLLVIDRLACEDTADVVSPGSSLEFMRFFEWRDSSFELVDSLPNATNCRNH
jgi:hypothetical protein